MTHARFQALSRGVAPRIGLCWALSAAPLACKGGEQKPDAGPAATPQTQAAQAKKDSPAAPKVSPAAMLDRVKSMFSPLPEIAEIPESPITQERSDLGRMLYYDPRLSKNHDTSCNTCHDLEHYGVDIREEDGKRIKTSLGHKKQLGDRNSPTVYNAAFHSSQFWDGRATTIEEQAKGPILNPVEMAMSDEVSVLGILRSIPGYEALFKAAFPGDAEPITYDNIAKAIGAFERKLVTPSRFDEFLSGKMTALSNEELRGLQLYLDVGCVTCHNGPVLGGTQFQKLGSVKPWPELKDEGRFKVTQNEADKYMFKVPSLRNITQTGPYLHDGSIESLEEIVNKMAEHQTARGTLTDAETGTIVAFLRALEGTLPMDYIAPPVLPESGPDTPAANPD